jgi:hypothetical protein
MSYGLIDYINNQPQSNSDQAGVGLQQFVSQMNQNNQPQQGGPTGQQFLDQNTQQIMQQGAQGAPKMPDLPKGNDSQTKGLIGSLFHGILGQVGSALGQEGNRKGGTMSGGGGGGGGGGGSLMGSLMGGGGSSIAAQPGMAGSIGAMSDAITPAFESGALGAGLGAEAGAGTAAAAAGEGMGMSAITDALAGSGGLVGSLLALFL